MEDVTACEACQEHPLPENLQQMEQLCRSGASKRTFGRPWASSEDNWGGPERPSEKSSPRSIRSESSISNSGREDWISVSFRAKTEAVLFDSSLMGIEATSIPTERHGGGSAGCTRAMEAATTGARTPGANAATAAAAAEPAPPNVATEGPDPEAPAKAMEAAASGESGLQGVLMPSEPPYPEVAPTAAKVSATARSASKSATAQIVP
eukprot:CAMPEP_0183422274 /NCGR_PEP_ID=MMETSP0370-20130417/27699_1 /TAXON_ID=268820 /ORGANISM="Peridinium aciculiferum, Strain PAER-2" /LENGTH=207 /DNA_ID=CAMNT_0025606351 /DNA_START=252 /DNA_END=876 /DNA_ORIENTATION=-